MLDRAIFCLPPKFDKSHFHRLSRGIYKFHFPEYKLEQGPSKPYSKGGGGGEYGENDNFLSIKQKMM